MGNSVLGIDLGTTNSVVSVVTGSEPEVLFDERSEPLVPSVVSFHPQGRILVGHPARERRLLDAANTVYSVKRLIGRPFDSEEVRQAQSRFPFKLCEGPRGGVDVQVRGETYSLSEISAFILRQVRSHVEAAIGQRITRAVITVPANFNELQRSATKAAGQVAGLEVLRILNEPTAAALAYGYGRGSRERIGIYDLGGGTFDLTIIELNGDVFEVLATAGDTYLGGDDIDHMIAENMADAFLERHRYDPRSDVQAFERLRAAAEWAKCQLTEQDTIQLKVEELAYGEGGVALDLSFGLSRKALERMAEPLIARTFDVCEEAMKVAQIRPTQLDNVILVGGSTRVPIVRRMVQDYFSRRPLSDLDPDLVVAMGAAIQGRALAGSPRTPRPRPSVAIGAMRLKKVATGVHAHPPQTGYRPPPPSFFQRDEALFSKSVVEDIGDAHDHPTLTRPETSEPAYDDGATNPSTRYADVVQIKAIPIASAAGELPPVRAEPPPPVRAEQPPPVPAEPPPPVPVSPTDELQEEASEPEESSPPAPTVPRAFPLLLDVTPLSLGVETVSGFSEHIIPRNAAIPVEQTRMFSTGQDFQQTVRVTICQGESRRIEENQMLGELELASLRSAPRGRVKIAVTFVIDVHGTLSVRAEDVETGQQQRVRIDLIGGIDEESIEELRKRHETLMGGATV
ncbi:MAG: Hsp70 family protein [Myxococcota bacterium]